MPTIPPTIPPAPTAPQRGDRNTFSARVDAFLTWLVGAVTQFGAVATNAYENAVAAHSNAELVQMLADPIIATSNYKGAWAGLSGSLNMPASVSHAGTFWALAANLANVATETPGVSSSWVPVVMGSIPQIVKSAAYTLKFTDAGKHILHPSSDTTARTFTVPANASVAYPIGTVINIVNQSGAGVITISINTDVMRWSPFGTTGSRLLAANGIATLVKLSSAEWIISGTGLS